VVLSVNPTDYIYILYILFYIYIRSRAQRCICTTIRAALWWCVVPCNLHRPFSRSCWLSHVFSDPWTAKINPHAGTCRSILQGNFAASGSAGRGVCRNPW